MLFHNCALQERIRISLIQLFYTSTPESICSNRTIKSIRLSCLQSSETQNEIVRLFQMKAITYYLLFLLNGAAWGKMEKSV